MIRTRLMKHQQLIVDFCMREETKEYAGIFSEYGTGKTLCALKLIEERGFKTVLIVAPKLAIESTWVDEIRKHTDFRYCILSGTAKQKLNLLSYALGKVRHPSRYGHFGESNRPVLFLINYEGVKSIWYELYRVQFDAIFADESTRIKTYNAERTKALYEVGERAGFRCIMTGFPATENLAELYSQIKFIDRGKTFGLSFWKFLNRYFLRIGYKLVIKKRSVNQILNAIKPFCIRITNDMLGLPPKVYKLIELEQTDQQRELLRSLNSTFRLEFGKVKIDTQYIFTLLMKSLQICDGFVQLVEKDDDDNVLSTNLEVVETKKDEVLVEVLDEIDVRKNKVVIWCAFLFSVSKVKKILEKLGIPVLVLTGESEDVNKIVQKFQRTKDYNVIICTQKKAAESVTLTEAKYAIYYSNTWSNDLRMNSEARIRRKGSEKHDSIIYIDLVTKGTVERKVYDCLRKKKDLIDELKVMFLQMSGGK